MVDIGSMGAIGGTVGGGFELPDPKSDVSADTIKQLQDQLESMSKNFIGGAGPVGDAIKNFLDQYHANHPSSAPQA